MEWVKPALLATLTLIFWACQAKMMVGKTPAEMYSDPNVVALVEAAIKGEEKGIANAVQAGAGVNAQSPEGATPLLWTANVQDFDGIRGLLRAGA